MINFKSKQRGTFSIEFSLIAIAFSMLLVFSGDVIIKLAVKGKLDRLSFSLVSILKERTQLYGEDYTIKAAETNAVYQIGEHSLQRTMQSYTASDFGALIEEQTFDNGGTANAAVRFYVGTLRCNVSDFLSELTHVSVVTSWGRQASLYRVTLCYDTDNWFGSLVGERFTRINSSSIMIGR